MARMPDGFIDLTVTSPPYDNLRDYKGYSFDFESIAKELFRVTKKGGVVVWVVGDATVNGSETGTSFRQALYFMLVGFNLHDTMFYRAKGTGAKGSIYSYWQEVEYMFVFSNGKPKCINLIRDKKNISAGSLKSPSKKLSITKTGRQNRKMTVQEYGIRGNCWEYATGFANNDDKTLHTAPFPEQLAADHLYSWSNEGHTVYDPFMGSGTTAKMAHLMNRNWIGSEISKEYCDLAEKRLRKYLNQTRLPLTA